MTFAFSFSHPFLTGTSTHSCSSNSGSSRFHPIISTTVATTTARKKRHVPVSSFSSSTPPSSTSSSSSTPDVIIIGAGLAGLATAFELSRTGTKVRILSSSQTTRRPGGHAAAGMLAPNSECLEQGPLLSLCRRSLHQFPSLVSALHAVVPEIDVGFSSVNNFLLPNLRDDSPLCTSPDARIQTTSNVHMIEPALSSLNVQSVTRCLDDATIDARKFMHALQLACDRMGVITMMNQTVHRVIVNETNRVTAVQTLEDGKFHYAAHFIVSNGSWMRSLLPNIPIRPTKGQMLSLTPPPSSTSSSSIGEDLFLRHVLYGKKCYIVPKGNNNNNDTSPCYYVGATMENVGFSTNVTAGAVASLLSNAIELVPQFENYSISETWAGLRSSTPDLYPVLGSSEFDNLSVASGFHRNGVLLAPITATIMAAVARGDTVDSEIQNYLDSFSPFRFLHESSEQQTQPSPVGSSTESNQSMNATHTSFHSSSPSEPKTVSKTTTTTTPSMSAPTATPKDERVMLYRILKDGSMEAVPPPEGWSKSQLNDPTKSKFNIHSTNADDDDDDDDDDDNEQPEVSAVSIEDTYQGGFEYNADVVDAANVDATNDAYDDVIANRERKDVEAHERLARAQNRAFGRTKSRFEEKPGSVVLSLSQEDVELFDKAKEKGLQDMRDFAAKFDPQDESVLATKRDLEIIQRQQTEAATRVVKTDDNDRLNGADVNNDLVESSEVATMLQTGSETDKDLGLSKDGYF